ncbi:hypothetical protein GGX14DRAFT_659562 [Mycena pura]|uniref:Uncharacterized protein n=1 Tax=Mycena pura TaxID=153505 RepID=A0AAD6V238_9AGAR|nr:hypothetical protein GGX14DRAFT_659562 [Mycena pura]
MGAQDHIPSQFAEDCLILVFICSIGFWNAWAGIGSALSALYTQLTLPTSFAAMLVICGYLSAISVMHVTTPALVSVETINMSVTSTVGTKGFPQWSPAAQKTHGRITAMDWEFHQSKTLGLFNGSLYEVIDSNLVDGTAEVLAVGFNITCWNVPATRIKVEEEGGVTETMWNKAQFTVGGNWPYAHIPILNNYIKIGPWVGDVITLYTTNVVLDVDGRAGSRVMLIRAGNLSLQALQCSQSLVTQRGRVRTASRVIMPESISPNIRKDHSKWTDHTSLSGEIDNQGTLMGGGCWTQIIVNSATSTMGLNENTDPAIGRPNTVWDINHAEAYLMQRLDMEPFDNNSTLGHTIYLHDIENAVSSLVASLFWIGGHVGNPEEAPTLSTGNTTAQEVLSAGRIDVSIGLCACLVLLFLVIILLADIPQPGSPFDNLGLLQMFWMFERHPHLSELLVQVEDPTDYNLREAGLVKVRLLDALASDDA